MARSATSDERDRAPPSLKAIRRKSDVFTNRKAEQNVEIDTACTIDRRDRAARGRVRVLFVDDETMILRGIRRIMQRAEEHYDLLFAESGADALAELARQPVDVIVSDLHMPAMNGAQLLRAVQDSHPTTVRVVLSGSTDSKLAFRSVPVAHQFVSKPFEPSKLRTALTRALSLRRLLADQTLVRLAGTGQGLPRAPVAYSRLSDLLSREETSCHDVAEFLGAHDSIQAKVRQSATRFFPAVADASLQGMTTALGADLMKHLVLITEAIEVFGRATVPGFDAESFQAESLAVGILARELHRREAARDDAFLGGALHDIGSLILAARVPDGYGRALARCGLGTPLAQAELEELGTTHADIGGYLLGTWGLPEPLVQAVALHHRPARIVAEETKLGASVHVANALVRDPSCHVVQTVEENAVGIASTCLRLLGYPDLEPLRRLASQMARASAQSRGNEHHEQEKPAAQSS